MTIRFKCPDCASVLKIKDELAGAAARCPKCKARFVVPEPDSTIDSMFDSREVDMDALGSSDTIPSAPQNAVDREHEIDPGPQNPSPEEIAAIELKTGAENPLSVHDSTDDLDVALGASAGDAGSSTETAQISSTATVDLSEMDDLDCPSMMVLVLLPTAGSTIVSTSVEQAGRSRFSPGLEAKSAEDPTSSRSKSSSTGFDPFSFLTNDRPAEVSDDRPRNELKSPVERPRAPAPSPVIDRPTPTRKTYEPSDDLSLTADSGDDFPSPQVQRPISRPTPAPPPARSAPEKVDLATAAKMMKKAIKDSQSAEAHQRDLDSKRGFDFTQIFQEFGLKGLAILVGGIALTYALYFTADRMFGSPLRLPKLGYVRGVITLDGKPLKGATIYFAPTEIEMAGSKKERIRTSVGTADERGEFRMMYIPSDRIEGVAVGKSRVWITHVGDKGKSIVPLEWSEAARQTKDVTEGRQSSPLEIKLVSKSK